MTLQTGRTTLVKQAVTDYVTKEPKIMPVAKTAPKPAAKPATKRAAAKPAPKAKPAAKTTAKAAPAAAPKAKSAAKPAAKAATKPAATTPRTVVSYEEKLAMVPSVVKDLKAGMTFPDARKKYVSTGLRKALAEKGYDIAGNKVEAETITGSTAAVLAKRIDAKRREGWPFFKIEVATGKTRNEVKALLEEHGYGDVATGRVVGAKGANKPAPAAKAAPKAKAAPAAAPKAKPAAKPAAKAATKPATKAKAATKKPGPRRVGARRPQPDA